MLRRLKKVKITKDDKVSVSWKVMNKKESWDEHSMTCAEEADPSFYDSLKVLAKTFCDICELPDTEIQNIIITGVSFSYSGDEEILGATIIGQKKLSKSDVNLNINTPHKFEKLHNENGDPKKLLPEESIDLLHRVREEAFRYVDGERSQMNVFQKAANDE